MKNRNPIARFVTLVNKPKVMQDKKKKAEHRRYNPLKTKDF